LESKYCAHFSRQTPGHAPSAGALTVLTSSLGLLTTASKSKDGSYAYNSATVPFLAESLKLTVSMYLLRSQQRSNPEVTVCADSIPECVPLFASFAVY
jgi:hypothetical protein